MYPYGYSNEVADNTGLLDQTSKAAVQAILDTHGEQYRAGSTYNTLVYHVSGDSVDWIWDHPKLRPKVAYGIELRDRGRQGFLLQKKYIKPTSEEFFAGMKTVLDMI